MSDNLEDLRERLEAKLARLEKLEDHIMKLFPKTVDARSVFVFEQRLKTATELYRLQLAYLQEIARIVEKIKQLEKDDEESVITEELRAVIREALKHNIVQA